MNIHRPSRVVFYISSILALLALISQFLTKLPIVGGNEFLVMVIAYVLLWLGVVLRGF